MSHAWAICDECGQPTPTPHYVTVRDDSGGPRWRTVQLCKRHAAPAQRIPLAERTLQKVVSHAL